MTEPKNLSSDVGRFFLLKGFRMIFFLFYITHILDVIQNYLYNQKDESNYFYLQRKTKFL